jgi:hypothetical protein
MATDAGPDQALPDQRVPDAVARDAEFVPDFEPPDAQIDQAVVDAEIDAALPDAALPDAEVDAEPDAFVPDANLDVLCDSDADCPADDYCERSGGVCRPGCRREVGTCSAGLGCDENHQCSDAACGPAEICGNDLDENCDGRIDEPEFCPDTCTAGADCDTGLEGVCASGLITCAEGRLGAPVCVAQTEASAEICGDGLDNNCNGRIDDPDACPASCVAGDDCDTGQLGECARGLTTCPEGPFGEPTCEAQAQPRSEICGDGLDNNCNGRIDDPDACPINCAAGDGCDTGLLGECTAGLVSCPEGPFGEPVCEAPAPAAQEVCGDGLDNDCDGRIDDPDACPAPDPCDQGLANLAEPPARISPFGVLAERPAAAAGSDAIGIAWYEPENLRLAFVRVALDTGQLSPALYFAAGNPSDPALSFGNDQWTLLYVADDADSGTRRVFRAQIDPAGVLTGAPVVIAEAQASARRPSLTYHRVADLTAAVWYVGEGANRRLRAAFLGADPVQPFDAGAASGIVNQIPHPVGLAIGFDSALAEYHLALAAWIDFQNTLDLRVYRTDGSLAFAPVNLSAGASFGGAVAFGINRYMVAWQELFGVMSRIVGTAGQTPLPQQTSLDIGRLPGSLAFNGNAFGLANAADAGNGRDLYFRGIDATGAGVDSARPIMITPDTQAWRPTLQHRSDTDYLVVWEEAAPDDNVAEVWFARGLMTCP